MNMRDGPIIWAYEICLRDRARLTRMRRIELSYTASRNARLTASVTLWT
jgi:hypothetical protein